MKRKTLFLLVATLLTAHAQAGWVYKATERAIDNKSSDEIRVEAVKDVGIEIVKGMGRDIPVQNAIRQIVPKTYILDADIPLPIQVQKVTWRGNRPWGIVLQDVLDSVGLQAEIRGHQIRVVSANAKASRKDDKPVPPPVPTWNIAKADKNLRVMLNRWAKDAGWQSLSWEVPFDITIDQDGSFVGSFELALQTVAESLRSTDTPIEFKLYENKAIRVLKLQKGGLK